MANLIHLKEKLSRVFSPVQAEVLSEVFIETQNESVKANDFRELKDVVKELAEAQRKTEVRLEELTEAQRKTEVRLEELAEAQRKTEVRLEELAEAQRKTEVRLEELAEAQKKLAEAQNKTEKELRNLARQVGGLSEAFGGSLEDFAIDLVPELLEKYWNFKSLDVGRDEFLVRGKTVEVDLVIRGQIKEKSIIVLGEVKSNVTLNEVYKFLNTVQEIQESNQEEFINKEVRIIFFGYRIQKDAREVIKEKGMYMVFTHGKIL